MKANTVYRSIVFVITTVIIFSLWDFIHQLLIDNTVLGISIWATVSLGTYRMVLKVVEILLLKIKFIKQLVFGNGYLEGTWVGCYKGLTGKPNFYIEFFEQNLEGLIIRGFCFSEDKKYKGCWVSENVTVDTIKGVLSYTYETDMVYNTYKNQGFSVFSFIRKEDNRKPEQLSGFSSDLFTGKKILSMEKRVTGKSCAIDDLLKEAIEFYQDNEMKFM